MKTRIVEVYNTQAQRTRYFCQYRWLFFWRSFKNPLMDEPTCAFSGGYVTRKGAERVVSSLETD